MSKSNDKKKKEREKRVAKQKLADAARRREAAKKSSDDASTKAPRAKKVITAGVKQQGQAQTQSHKPQILPRRSGG